jgi:hypothetical protein
MLERRVAVGNSSARLVSRALEIAAEIAAAIRLEGEGIEVHDIACSGLGARGRGISDA